MDWKNQIANGISKSPLFIDIPEEVLREFFQVAKERVVSANGIVFQQGDPGDTFYIVNSGNVRVFRRSKEGVDVELARLGPGDSFGEMALLTGEPRSAYVEALEETYLTVISKEQFDRILKDHPHVSSFILRKLSDWLVKGDLRFEREVERQFRVPSLSCFDLLIILILSLLFSVTFNLSNPNGIKFLSKSWSGEAIPTVAPTLAIEKYLEGKTLFVDAMPSNFFDQQHIKGAMNLPLALFDIMYMLELNEVDKGKEIIAYGRTISRLYDRDVARKLILRGHRNTKILKGGLSNWKKYGNPVEP